MPSKSRSRTLTGHDEIRRWAEERGARPSVVRTTRDAENSGIIRLDFPGYSGADSLEEIAWDEWFEDFDHRNLALIVQDQTANGALSNFNKLVSRESIEDYSGETSERKSGRKPTKKTADRRKSPAASKTKASFNKASSTSSGKHRKTQHSQRSSKRKAA